MALLCPWCQGERTRRCRTRGFFEGFLAKLIVQPFRCEHCDCRFFRWSPKRKSNSGISTGVGLFSTMSSAPTARAA